MDDPYPFQLEGAATLAANPRWYLGDGMGLGKTMQAILAASKVDAKRPLIVAPASAVENWRREWAKWDGPGKPEFWSYTMFTQQKPKLNPDLLIADEAHYLKSASAQRTRAVLQAARAAPRSWLLSGTPMPNHPGELWPVVKALWPSIAESHNCRTLHDWLNTFCLLRPTVYGPKPYAVKNGPSLRESINKFMLRRRLADVGLQLPPLRVHLQTLPRTTQLARDLQEYEDMEGSEEAYTSTLRRLLGEAKAYPIADIVAQELHDKAYGQVVILYYHTAVGDRIRGALKSRQITTTGFGGSTPKPQRQEAIDLFQSGRAQAFVAQMTAAGIAITLTAASEIILVEPAWSPDDNDQAIKRIHRIGQDKPCRARIFTVADTLDEAVMGTVFNKLKMQKEVGLL